MESQTKYDIIVNYLLDNWIIAIIIVFLLVIGAIPDIRDGFTQFLELLKLKSKDNEFKIISDGETITFELKTSSASFDIVKVNSSTHILGVNAERQWIEKYYPDYRLSQQSLKPITMENNQLRYYDVLNIRNKNGKEKSIYFDISSFFNEYGSTSHNKDRFIESKIREMHKNETQK